MGEVALGGHHRPRYGLDPRRARSHHRRHAVGPDREAGQRRAHLTEPDQWACRRPLRDRCVRRCAVLRLAHRPVRPQEALHDHAGRIPARHGHDGAVVLRLVVLPVPVPDRFRHRRRIRGDQLRYRRADPEEASRPHRYRHQRYVLARRRRRRAADRTADQRPAGRRRLARCLRPRRRSRPRHPAGATERAREPAVAVHPRSQA